MRGFLLGGASALAVASPAFAQTTAQIPMSPDRLSQASQLDEIVVTAQRRSENVQDVPIAVAAFNGKMLEERGVTEVVQLANYTPSVQLTNSSQIISSPSVLSGFIRGIGQDDFSASFEPGVGTYVDGVYLARTIGANANLLDIARIEILKGPQGTLFGRNTIGGAINIVTRDPGRNFGVRGQVSVGSFDRIDAGIGLDLPFVPDKLLSSIAVNISDRGGYQHRIGYPGASAFATDPINAFPGTGFGSRDTAGGGDEQNVRAKLQWVGTPGLRLTLSADYGEASTSATPASLIATTQTAPAGPGGLSLVGLYNTCINTPSDVITAIGLGAVCGPRAGVGTGLAGVNADGVTTNDRLTYDDRFLTGDIGTTYATGNNFSDQTNYGVALTAEFDLTDTMTLKSITAYRALEWNVGSDLDGSPVIIFEPTIYLDQEQFSQELQLSGVAFGERLNYLVGAYYFKENAFEETDVIFPGALQQIYAPNSIDTESYAFFTHLNYRINDLVSVTLGARYTEEHKKFEGGQTDLNQLLIKAGTPPALFPDPADLGRLYPLGRFEQDFDNFSPRLGVEVKPTEDTMLYVSYSKGYKSGGFTSRVTFPVFDAPTFGPEEATTVELGVKSQFLDRRLQINTAIFSTDYDGIQLSIQRGVSPTFENAGDARIRGVEVEVQALVTEALRFNASVGYLDVGYRRVNDPTGVITTGSDLPKVPEVTFHIGPEYRLLLANNAEITLRGDYSYRSEVANDAENTPFLYGDSIGTVDLSATFAVPGDAWAITVGGRNVFDERNIVNGVNQLGGVGNAFAVYNRPAEWYLTLRSSF